MALVEVTEVATRQQPHEQVLGFSLDFPTAGSSSDLYGLSIGGWFLPRSESTELRLVIPDQANEVLALNVARRDVAESYTGVPVATRCGFETARSVIRLPRQFEIQLLAALPDGDKVWLATVRCRRESLPSVDEPRFNPIMLTTLGRTGGTWVTNLLGCHPEIAAMRPFDYESRIAAYWMDIFAALAEPQSYFQCLGAEQGDSAHWWLGGQRAVESWGWTLRPDTAATSHDRAFARWFGRENVEDLLSSFLSRIDKTYAHVAQDKTGARFFVERYWPQSPVQATMCEIFPQAREIILVRDPRDMVASILAFNKRRDRQLFGRDSFDSDEEYVRSGFLGGWVRGLLDVHRQRSTTSYLVRYEDLVAMPQDALQSLLNYIGVDDSPGVIDRMLRDSKGDATDAQEAHQTSASTQASIGRWRQDLDGPLQEACEEVFEDVLSELGYEKAASRPEVSGV